MNLNVLLESAYQMKCSDLHLTVGNTPLMRIHGSFVNFGSSELNAGEVEDLAYGLLGEKERKTFKENGEVDFALSLGSSGVRIRGNIFRQNNGFGVALRFLNSKVPSIKELGLPDIAAGLVEKSRGLVLVTGPTGSGKSTTLACMINKINEERGEHIITLEEPIEYLHKNKKSIVNQREIGRDSKSFESALRAALRQDPDVILIGEMRDTETISIALKAAETGHLVLSTLHTVGAAKTIDRIIDVFSPHQQQQIRTQLSTVLQGVISQQLIPRKDGGGRVAAVEVMVANPAIRNLIREGKTHQIFNVIQTSAAAGMKHMDQAIINLYRDRHISIESALAYSVDSDYVNKQIGA